MLVPIKYMTCDDYVLCTKIKSTKLFLIYLWLWVVSSRGVVVSCEAKKQHACLQAFTITTVSTWMAALNFKNAVAQPLLQLLLNLLQSNTSY